MSLKAENNPQLFLVVAANIAAYYLVLKGALIGSEGWAALLRNPSEVLPAGVGLIGIALANSQLSAIAKARIVFLRWRHPLPGNAALDPRSDLTALERDHGPLPTDPGDQNRLWYRWYVSVGQEPQVLDANRAYLFHRDYTCLALLMLIILVPAALVQVPSIGVIWLYIIGMVAQLGLAGRAARNHAERLVTAVLALKSAER
jgi:hypothetical protein